MIPQCAPEAEHRATSAKRSPRKVAPAFDSWLSRTFGGPDDSEWSLLAENAGSGKQHAVEARLAIGNGAFGMRASLVQSPRESRPATFIAGLFQTLNREPQIPALVVTPDWLRLDVCVEGEPVEIDSGVTLTYWRALDLRRALLVSEWRQRTPSGRVVRLRTLRLASLAARSLALQLADVMVESPSLVQLRPDIRCAPGLELVNTTPGLQTWRTSDDVAWLAVAFNTQDADRRRHVVDGADAHESTWSWSAIPAQPETFVRLVAHAHGVGAEAEVIERATTSLRRARRHGLSQLIRDHFNVWNRRWEASGVEVDGDAAAQTALRFAVYHMVSAANPENEHVSIGARGLTGEAYLGHVFWDTEIFLIPFYTLTWPEAAHALLLYRYHTLPAAREKAARLGYRGALYAWESTDTGEEATPRWGVGSDGRVVPILSGSQEHHISGDVAYAVWQYWQVTGDVRFLLDAGAEIILETARFWASRAMLEDDGRYHIRGVIGPDEYHESVDDNAYTNGLAVRNLNRGVTVAAYLRARWSDRWAQLSRKLNLSESEVTTWHDVAARMAQRIDPQSGLIEQFAGFFNLEDVDLRAYASRTTPMDVLLGPERTRRSQVIKQADVLMLLALFPEEYDRQVQLTNFGYYEPRCGQGSSLSPSIHALLAARLGDGDLAERYFRQGASIDLDDTRGDTGLGVHMGALGGLWQATVFGFGGLTLGANGLRLAPRLPPSWERLAFRIRWRKRQLSFEVDRKLARIVVQLEQGRPTCIEIQGAGRRLAGRAPVVCPMASVES